MGSPGSKSRLSQVAPCHSRGEGDQQTSHPAPQWTLPALPTSPEQQQRPLGHGRTTLPPLRLENNKSLLTLPAESSFTGSLPQSQNLPSIIPSHPPRRPQALQSLTPRTGLSAAASQVAMARDCRDGGDTPCSTPSQVGRGGNGRQVQGGRLEAQMVISQQTHRRRRAHQRRAREQRAQERTAYAADRPDREGSQRLRLVRRPTERDIFWDESRGESLDLGALLRPSPPHLEQERQHTRPETQHLLGGDEPTICRGLAGGRRRSPRNRESETDRHAGLSLERSLPWMLDWNRERSTSHLGSLGDTGRSGWNMWHEPARARQRDRGGIRGVCHGRRGIWDPELE